MGKKAIIIGAGPAGLTAAYELLQRTDITPIILEKSDAIGGISKTINYKGNRMDMGPHRFFSKSDRVMQWWLNIMPLENAAAGEQTIQYQNKRRTISTDRNNTPETPGNPDKVMLVIPRLTRIYFLRKFFAYPIQLGLDTLKTLGFARTIKILVSYLYIRVFPRKPEKSLEDFIINKFGRQLYLLFFKDYTEKVWGVPCKDISAEWGAQRIKGVSLSKAIGHAVKTLAKGRGKNGIGQKNTETSLIEQFLYPKHGPGSLWEEVARQVEARGGAIYTNQDVKKIYSDNPKIARITTVNLQTGQESDWEGDYFFSSMPVQELIAGMDGPVPGEVREIAAGLQYRDFINVGVLLRQLSASGGKKGLREKLALKDNWIYIQERDVKVGRLMIYNNWGDGMIKDPDTVWIGMEYFSNKTDALWAMDNESIKQLAIAELEQMDLAQAGDVLDATVERMEKTYPAYFGTYERFDEIKTFVNRYENLFLVGRNGMHKYNNADHSMLTAMVSVDNIIAGVTSKENLWAINTEQEYHEEKKPVNAIPEPIPQLSEPSLQLAPLAFKDFVFKKHKRIAIASLLCLVVQFVFFKFLYPYPNFMPDSYSYLDAATKNMDINMWPIGYSKFLRVFSAFTHSDTALVGFQYLFLQATVLCFVFTLWYFFKPGKVARWAMWVFFVFNPAFLYISNYISADALFIGVSLLWVCQLLWILYQPGRRVLYLHGILLLVAFMLRLNALVYPFISIIVILVSKNAWRTRLASIGFSILLVGLFAWHTGNQYQSATGQRQFSAFGGWQLASNALFMYSHTYKETPAPPAQFAVLDKLVRTHIDSLSRLKHRPDSTVNIYYLWWGPLPKYLVTQTKKDTAHTYFDKWAAMAPLYSAYGSWLIRQHPLAFIKYYLWPNTIHYYVPEVEFLGQYNMKRSQVDKTAKTWFGYKDTKVKGYQRELFLFQYYPITLAIINVVFAAGLLGFIVLNGFKEQRRQLGPALWLVLGIWAVNLGFSVFASPIVLRYQLFPMVLAFSFALLLLGYVYKKAMGRTSPDANLPAAV